MAPGSGPYYPGGRYCPTPPIAHGRTMPARRLREPGWVSAVNVWPAAFLGAVGMAAPHLTQRPPRLTEPGLAPHLEAGVITGEGPSKLAGRNRNFPAPGFEVARAFVKACGGMRTETGAGPEGGFAVPAADAPGLVRAEGFRVDDALRPHAQ